MDSDSPPAQWSFHKFPVNTKIIKMLEIIFHLSSVTLNDPIYFPEPEKFRPERFIDAKNGTLQRLEAFLPFSIGKR
jgi:cytochrome P450